MRAAATQAPPHDVSHLADFHLDRRVLGIIGLALPIGAAAAGVAWCLLRLIGLITNLVFFHRLATSLVAPDSNHVFWVTILLAPVVGGLVVGVLARYGSERIRGHGMPEALEAVLVRRSLIQPRVAVLKPVASAIAIGTGGPFGAEGPIIMTGGAVGSLIAQSFRLTADERKTLLVAGAAAGMTAVFNTPLAAVLLAVELLLFEWRPRSFVPVAAAVSLADVVRWVIVGTGRLFPVPVPFHVTAAAAGFSILAGLSAAGLAVVATALVYASEDAFHRLPIHWMWWPAIGGLIIGLGGLVVPQALGVGYDVIRGELSGSIGMGLIVGVLVVKTLIWSLSLGSGTSGGVLAPLFLIGGALGSLEGHVFPHVGVGFWPMVALAGVLGGVMRCPLTGIVFPVELTGRWEAFLPLLISSAVSYLASALVLKRSILTEKIARRGHHIFREYDVDPLENLLVIDALQPDAPDLNDPAVMNLPPVYVDATLREATYVMTEHAVTRALVVRRDDPSQPVGVLRLIDVLVGRRRDLEEMRDSERVLQLWSWHRRAGTAQPPPVPRPDIEEVIGAATGPQDGHQEVASPQQ